MASVLIFACFLSTLSYFSTADEPGICQQVGGERCASTMVETEAETMDGVIANEMQFQLLQSSTSMERAQIQRPAEQDNTYEAAPMSLSQSQTAGDLTPWQIRQQAQAKRIQMMHEEAKALMEKKTRSQNMMAQERQAQLTGKKMSFLDPDSIAEQAAAIAAQVGQQMAASQMALEAPVQKKVKRTVINVHKLMSSSQGAMDDLSSRALDRRHVPARFVHQTRNLQAQRDARLRAMKRRFLVKKHAAHWSPKQARDVEAERAAETAKTLQTAQKLAAQAAMTASMKALEDQGVNPEDLKRAQDLLSSAPATSLLDTSQSNITGGPEAARAEMAKEMLKMQELKRASAQRIRMSASGVSKTWAEARQEAEEMQMVEEMKKTAEEEERLKKEEEKRKEARLTASERAAEMRSKGMQEKMRMQKSTRNAAAEVKQKHRQEVHEKQCVLADENNSSISSWMFKPPPQDAKVSPAARKHQIQRLVKAQLAEHKQTMQQRAKTLAAEASKSKVQKGSEEEDDEAAE